MITFKSISVSPNPVKAKGSLKIVVDVISDLSVFQFPLMLQKPNTVFLEQKGAEDK